MSTAPSALAAPPASESAEVEAARLVRSALQFEAKGDAEYRRLLLELALNQDADFAPARWQSGYVRDGDGWQALADFESSKAKDQRLAEYAERREKAIARESAEVHLSLARWCLRNELTDQARYHLAQVFRLPATPEIFQEAARHLSFKLLREAGAEGVLLGEEELARRREEAAQAQADWQTWAPVLERIAAQMASDDEAERKAALNELGQIDDPAAVAAQESIVSQRGDEHALAVVDVLSGITEHEATMSLARHAVFAESREVREAAAEQLVKRPLHDYAPWLLSSLGSPVKSKFWIQPLPNGSFRYLHDFYREGVDRNFALRHDVQMKGVPQVVRYGVRQQKFLDQPKPQFSQELIGLELVSQAVQAEDEALRQNQRAEFVNKRIDSVLELGTGQKMNADPVAWWDWWQRYNELQTPDNKQLVASYSSTRMTYPGGYAIQLVPSCFPAETTVWTESGARAIETIHGGDKVLAQDVETGELAYKTVLGTTIRPPTPLFAIRAGGEEIRATKGHPFWVSGAGWKMAKFLEAGERLHCASEFLTIESIADAEAKPAYNLIVEDFATYFVGEQRLLVHDNTLRAPTLATVPGLVEK